MLGSGLKRSTNSGVRRDLRSAGWMRGRMGGSRSLGDAGRVGVAFGGNERLVATGVLFESIVWAKLCSGRLLWSVSGVVKRS